MRDGKAVPHPTKVNVNGPGPGTREAPDPPARSARRSPQPARTVTLMPMTDNTRPPADLEYKSAPTMLAPRPGVAAPATGTVVPEGIVELIAAVTGVKDDVR